MKPFYLLLALPLLFASCSLFEEGEYTPEYLKEASPLDPPGTAEAREAARLKLVKEGMFVTGANIDVRDGKAFLFNRNPDHAQDTLLRGYLLLCGGRRRQARFFA